MTKLVEQAVAAISKLPAETQDDLAGSCWRWQRGADTVTDDEPKPSPRPKLRSPAANGCPGNRPGISSPMDYEGRLRASFATGHREHLGPFG